MKTLKISLLFLTLSIGIFTVSCRNCITKTTSTSDSSSSAMGTGSASSDTGTGNDNGNSVSGSGVSGKMSNSATGKSSPATGGSAGSANDMNTSSAADSTNNGGNSRMVKARSRSKTVNTPTTPPVNNPPKGTLGNSVDANAQ